MKQRLTALLAFVLFLQAFPVAAQDGGASVYEVADVAVDVTADSAAKARDQAIAEAQRTAFTQLLERLGAPASAAAKLSNDDLSTLVQNFEVRNERASAIRYIGVFAVQFRPNAVRNFLDSRSASFNDTQANPVLVLPVVKNGDKAILWEEPTRWQKTWLGTAGDGGIVPVIIPTGSAEEQALLSGADAAHGKTAAIKAVMQRYNADSAYVVTLNGALDNPANGYTIDIQHFGTHYDDGSDVTHINLMGTPDRGALDNLLAQGVRLTRNQIVKTEKQEPSEARKPVPHLPDVASTPAPLPDTAPATWSSEEPPARLPVTVQFTDLGQWAAIQRQMAIAPGIRRVDVVTLGRGEAQIELGFAGTPQDIQLALAQHNLRLTQDILSGQWMLKGF